MTEIPVKDLEISKFNVRRSVGDFTELLNSIEEKGVIEPLIVRPVGKRFEVIIGSRRLIAAKAAGLKKVPVVVREMDDVDAVALSLVENIQRGDLEPEEEYDAYQKMMKLNPKRFDSHRKIAKAIGKGSVHVDRIFDSVEITRDLKVLPRKHPALEEREAGEAIPLRHATMVAQAFKH